MNASITVRDRKEADTIRRALKEPDVRAFVLVIGTLLPLPSDRARMRVLNFVRDQLAEVKFAIHTKAT